jgi:hypothetical protein
MAGTDEEPDWPEHNNFYAHVPDADPETLADSFQNLGWTVGKESWHEFHVANDWAEFVFMPEKGVLISGVVRPGRYADAVAVFATAGHPCTADPEET